MEKDEAIKIMEMLYAFYPNFNRNNASSFNKLWIERLMNDGDYGKTLRKTNEYTAEKKYPPSLADIIVKVYIPRDDNMAELIKEAEESVKREKADPEVAARRERKLQEMRRKLGAYYGD